MARKAFALLAVTALLAGCSGAPAADTPTGAAGETACDGDACADAALLTADSSVPAPSWQVGQWWEWEPADASGTGEPFRSVVLAAGASRTVGTDSIDRAKQAATFDHVLIGEVSTSLGVAAWGGSWDLLSFPLTHGKTWATSVPNIAWDTLPDQVDLAMRADFDEELQGFRFMGHTPEAMVLEGTYLPATGWYGELVVYDIDPGQDPLEFSLTAKQAGLNFTGTVYTATAEELLTLVDVNGFDDDPAAGGQPIVRQPEPHGTFTMADGTHLYGVAVAVSIVGTRVITITDPAQEQRQVVSAGTPEDEQVLWLDEPAVPGQWTVATSGAGGLSLAEVELYAVTVTETVL